MVFEFKPLCDFSRYIRSMVDEEIWIYPNDLYDRYRSATLHTASHKFKVPKRVWQGLSVAAALIGILWLGWLFLIEPSNAQAAKMEEQGAGLSPRHPARLSHRHML